MSHLSFKYLNIYKQIASSFKMGKYKEKCNEVARKVAATVLEWLSEQYPDRQFDAYYHRAALPDGPVFLTSRVYQIGPGALRGIFPKRIADIGQFNIHHQDLSQTYDERTLSWKKLEELTKGVNILDTWAKNLPLRPKSLYEKFLDWVEKSYEATSPRKRND